MITAVVTFKLPPEISREKWQDVGTPILEFH